MGPTLPMWGWGGSCLLLGPSPVWVRGRAEGHHFSGLSPFDTVIKRVTQSLISLHGRGLWLAGRGGASRQDPPGLAFSTLPCCSASAEMPGPCPIPLWYQGIPSMPRLHLLRHQPLSARLASKDGLQGEPFSACQGSSGGQDPWGRSRDAVWTAAIVWLLGEASIQGDLWVGQGVL